jgi:membrane-bound lytic murein transglycosylase D
MTMLIKSCLFFVCIISLTACSNFQANHSGELENLSTEEDSSAENEQMLELDPVLESTRLALQQSEASDKQQITEHTEKTTLQSAEAKTKPQFSSAWERLQSNYQMTGINHPRIETQKKRFLNDPLYFQTISKRAAPFLHFIIEEVEKRGMPSEIALLPAIESAFKPRAYSRQRASGLWQFVPATGRFFGLKQNRWYDGRRDIYSSTRAALTYLQQLNHYYDGDWLLALAAYNAGSGNVNKAIRKNRQKGKAVDYWSLKLPRETRLYVPKLIAINQIIQQPEKYDVRLYPIQNKPVVQVVDIGSQIDLSVVSRLSGLEESQIKFYNPGLKKWSTSPSGPHHLLLPIEKVNKFETELAVLDDKDRVKYRQHHIQRGDSLSVIARRYGVSVKDIQRSNNLKSHRIRAGKYLLIPNAGEAVIAYQPKEDKNPAAQSNTAVYTVKKGDSFWTIARRHKLSHKKLASINGLATGSTLSIGQKLYLPLNDSTKSFEDNQAINYIVKRGDSLYDISRRFNVSINQLRDWNDLKRSKYLQPGQELRVYISTMSEQTI